MTKCKNVKIKSLQMRGDEKPQKESVIETEIPEFPSQGKPPHNCVNRNGIRCWRMHERNISMLSKVQLCKNQKKLI